jgi:arabinogalactan endo-1,4-beta-galactosidase
VRDPKIVVGLSETGERDAIVVKRTDGQGVLHYVAWELSQVENEGYMALCVKVGNAVLRMLAGAHEDTFQNYSLVMPPKPVDADVEGIVLHLIHMTHKQKTKAYVATIDELIRRNSTEFENSSIPESWSNLRIAALSFPD